MNHCLKEKYPVIHLSMDFDVNRRKQLTVDYEQIPLVTFDQALECLLPIDPHFEQIKTTVQNKCQRLNSEHLSTDEIASIMIFTEKSFSSILNQTLSSFDQLESWFGYLKLFSSSLNKLPRIVSHRIFYKSIEKNDSILEGELFFSNAYISCQIHPQATNDCLLIIHTNQAIDIRDYSLNSNDTQILIPFGKQFQIVSNKHNCQLLVIKEIDPMISIKSIDHVTTEQTLENRLKKYKLFDEINLRKLNLVDSQMNLIVQYAFEENECIWLSLEHNYLTCQSLIILSEYLKTNDCLQSLYLSGNYFSDSGIFYLAKSLSERNTNLTFLSLDSNEIRDQGVQYLAKMLKTNRILTDLWLSNNKISDAGVKSLVKVLEFFNRTLKQLYLDRNELITDDCVVSIIRMIRFNRILNTLRLNDCQLTVNGKDQLQKSIKTRDNFDLCV